MSTINSKTLIGWLGAGACSLGLHIVVITIFVLIGGSSSKPANAAAAQSEPAPAESAEKPSDDPAGGGTENETPPTDLDTVGQPPARTPKRPVRPTANPPSNRNGRSNAKPAPPANDAPVKTKSYKVKAGDNLTRLARECGSTPEELAKLNGKDVKQMADLKVGQTIKVKDND